MSNIHYFKIFRLSHLLMCITNVERQEASRKLNQTNTKKEFHVEEIKTPNKRSRKRKKLPSISSSPPTRFLWPMECASTATVDRICAPSDLSSPAYDPEGGGFLSSASPAMVCGWVGDEVERGLGSGFRTHVTGGLMALDEILTRLRLDGRSGRSSAADGARDVSHVSDVILANALVPALGKV
ncbi:hypothetical protein Bca52824_047909 [Brassica carinata]|uniref:Uncharacterized protein n=1 Tax=Brassica carinata TaxID=52824 RepID=A0A8X7RHG6_BRACI|nr:hypothetical protein Bca52824_047909 [Brassica carinata]